MSQTRIQRFQTTRLLPRSHAASRPRDATRRRQFAPLPPRLERGDRLGAFRIEREISSGGAARVYAASDARTKRCAALKVLSAHLGQDPEAERRFEAEYRLASRVPHAGIVRVVSWGREGVHLFYAMELLSGETAGALPPAVGGDDAEEEGFARLALVFAGVARALEALHARGIVHRDVKPDNLLIDRGGSLVLSDFGSALDARERDPLLERCLSGTLRYMSPEQFWTGADPYDPLQDIYSLGLVLYEAATGIAAVPRLPEKEIARWKLSRLPALPRALNPRVPLGLEAIIRRAIDPEPRLRYAAAGELARDLERYATLRRGSSR